MENLLQTKGDGFEMKSKCVMGCKLVNITKKRAIIYFTVEYMQKDWISRVCLNLRKLIP